MGWGLMAWSPWDPGAVLSLFEVRDGLLPWTRVPSETRGEESATLGVGLRKDCATLYVLCCTSDLENASSPASVLASPIQKPLPLTASFPGEVCPGKPMDLVCWQHFSWGLLLG